jgi:hypothetical protein
MSKWFGLSLTKCGKVCVRTHTHAGVIFLVASLGEANFASDCMP